LKSKKSNAIIINVTFLSFFPFFEPVLIWLRNHNVMELGLLFKWIRKALGCAISTLIPIPTRKTGGKKDGWGDGSPSCFFFGRGKEKRKKIPETFPISKSPLPLSFPLLLSFPFPFAILLFQPEVKKKGVKEEKKRGEKEEKKRGEKEEKEEKEVKRRERGEKKRKK
jgi:hypothetical protein